MRQQHNKDKEKEKRKTKEKEKENKMDIDTLCFLLVLQRLHCGFHHLCLWVLPHPSSLIYFKSSWELSSCFRNLLSHRQDITHREQDPGSVQVVLAFECDDVIRSARVAETESAPSMSSSRFSVGKGVSWFSSFQTDPSASCRRQSTLIRGWQACSSCLEVHRRCGWPRGW